MNAARLVALTTALVLPLGALSLTSGSLTAQAGPSATAARKATSVTVRSLPQIVQPGARTASPAKAKVPLIVNVTPKRRTVVTLQVRTPQKKWRTLRRATTDGKGRAVLRVVAKRNGAPATYRVRVGAKVSKPTSTERWMRPAFSDTFSGRKLGKAWSHRGTTYNPSVRRCSRGSAAATRVKGGTLRLSVLKDPKRKRKCVTRVGGKTVRHAYRLNGHVGTQESYTFTYGVAAARVKFPRQAGQHGAFWLQVDSPDLRTINPKRNGTEMDVVESYGAHWGDNNSLGLGTGIHRYVKRKGAITTISDGGYIPNARKYLSGPKDSYYGRYHVFSVEWTPRYYIYRIDGQEYWRTHKGISGTPQFPILSLLSSDYELGRLARGDKDLPQHMHVDWLRVWETGPSSSK